ncbi:MAG: helix-turn-helix domain-containing protein [Thermodesulfobacteriota bacterium]
MIESNRFLYVYTVAKTLACSPGLVYQLVKRGELDAIKVGKRGIRISRNSLELYIERNLLRTERTERMECRGGS